MLLNEGFVLAKEFTSKAGISKTAIYYMKDLERSMLGKGFVIIRINSVPLKFRHFAEQCTDLSRHTLTSEIENCLGLNQDALLGKLRSGKMVMPMVKVGKTRLYQLPDDFIEIFKKGKLPYIISEDGIDSEDDEECDFYGMRVGFY